MKQNSKGKNNVFIDINRECIILSDINLKSHQERQLSFWKFQKKGKDPYDKEYILCTENNIEMLPKIISYFDKQAISFKLSSVADNLYQKVVDNAQDFSVRKEKLREYKNGKFEKEIYRGFHKFLEDNIKRPLKKHQEKAAFHLYLAKNGANFSVPGSGKTSVVLSVYEKLRQEGIVDTLFVVGPPAVFGPWKEEFESTLGRKPKYQILAGGKRKERKLEYFPDAKGKSELYLSTFQTVLMDGKELGELLKSKHIKAYFVIDEAHYIKQLNGNWANTILDLSNDAVLRCVLTGTPMPKSYGDVFNLFNFLWPQNHPIDEVIAQTILNLEHDKQNEEAKLILEEKIGPLFYRVRKIDLNLTQQVFHNPVLLPMNQYEREVYRVIENKIQEKTKLDDINDIELVLKLRKGRLIRLRQTVSYVGLLKKAIEGYSENLYDEYSDIGKYIKNYDSTETPAKVEYILKMLKSFKNKGEKVIIWSNFVGTIELLSMLINKEGHYNKIIYGKTPIQQTTVSDEEDREKIRDEFVDPNSGLDVLIANPAACAESISLHKTCHHAIYYDLSYNCAQYLQSIDRIHRVGGSEDTLANYYFLQYENTFETDIKENLEKKAEKMYQLIDQDYSVYSLDMFEDDEVSAYERLFK